MEADHHDNGRRRNSEVQFAGIRTQHFDKRVVDDLDDLLPGSNRLQDRLSDGLFGYLVDKFTCDGKCDVGFEQGNANFAHRLSNVGFVQRTTTAQAIKYASQPVAQLVEHQTSFVKPAGNAQNAGGRNLADRRMMFQHIKWGEPWLLLGSPLIAFTKKCKRTKTVGRTAG